MLHVHVHYVHLYREPHLPSQVSLIESLWTDDDGNEVHLLLIICVSLGTFTVNTYMYMCVLGTFTISLYHRYMYMYIISLYHRYMYIIIHVPQIHVHTSMLKPRF